MIDEERDNNYEVTEHAVADHLEWVLETKGHIKETKKYLEQRVAAAAAPSMHAARCLGQLQRATAASA